MDAVTGRRVCTREMMDETVANCRERGIVSRIDGVTPPSHELTAFIRKNYDLVPSAGTILRLRNEVMADLKLAITTPPRQQQPVPLRPEIEQVLDRIVQQTETTVSELARTLASIQKRIEDEFATRLGLCIEQSNQDTRQNQDLMTEELETASRRICELEETVEGLTGELDAAKASAVAERARAETFEQINATLLARFTGAPVRADEQEAVSQQDATDQPQPPEQPVVNSSRRGRGRPRTVTSQTEKEAA